MSRYGGDTGCLIVLSGDEWVVERVSFRPGSLDGHLASFYDERA